MMLSELDNYRHRIDNLRNQVGELISGLSAPVLNCHPFDGVAGIVEKTPANSLAALTAHIAGVENYWIAEVIGCRHAVRDRTAELLITVDGVDELLDILQATASETHEVLSQYNAVDLSQLRKVDGREVNMRWSLLHVVDHTALHLGHMQLTYQLWHGGVAVNSPFWFQRLPQDAG